MSCGDYVYFQTVYQGWQADATLLAATDWTSGHELALLAAPPTGYTHYVQRIVFGVTTSTSATLTFEDGAGTPVVFAKSTATPGTVNLVWDFGPAGTPLTTATKLQVLASATGLAGIIHAEGYTKQTINLTGQNTAQTDRWKTSNP